jgi:hypothetical protein
MFKYLEILSQYVSLCIIELPLYFREFGNKKIKYYTKTVTNLPRGECISVNLIRTVGARMDSKHQATHI